MTAMTARPLVPLLMLAAAAAPLRAQHHDMPDMSHMQQMQDMMGPMMQGMAFAPDHLLARKDSLGLTADQVTRLTALRDAAKAAHDRAADAAKTHAMAMAQAFDTAAPDTGAVHQHFQAAHQAMGEANWAMLRAAAQARALLTDSQRARVAAWAHAMPMMQHRDHDDSSHKGEHGPSH
jgi:hypothetical protein